MEKICSRCYVSKQYNPSQFSSILQNIVENKSSYENEQSFCNQDCCEECFKLLKIYSDMPACGDHFRSATNKDDITRTCHERRINIEKKIHLLKSESKALKDNSTKLKQEVRSAIDSEISFLRNREVALCSQVDALDNQQNSQVQEHLFKLHTILGSLQNFLHLNDYDNSKPFMDVAYEEAMECLPTTKKFKFLASEDLKPLVQSYGKFMGPNGQIEVFVPSGEEMYEENNSFLSKATSMEDIPEKEDWYNETEKQIKSLKCSIVEESPQSLLKQALHAQMCKGKFPFHPEKSQSTSPCSTDSFEVIMLDAELNPKHKESGSCNCNQPADMDIESLGELSCTSTHSSKHMDDIAEWLKHNESADNSKVPLTVPPIKTLCKADGVCSSYSACVCDSNCLVSHLKEQLERIRLAGNAFSKQQLNNTINQVIQIEANKSESGDMMDLGKQFLSSQWDANSWLMCKENSQCIPVEAESWLYDSSRSVGADDAKNIVEDMFSSYFAKNSSKEWLYVPLGEGEENKSCSIF